MPQAILRAAIVIESLFAVIYFCVGSWRRTVVSRFFVFGILPLLVCAFGATPLVAQSVRYSVRDIGLLPGSSYSYTYPGDINNLGQVTGDMIDSNNHYSHAFVTGPNGVGLTNLGAFRQDFVFSSGRGINDSGVVVGYSPAFSNFHGFVSAPNGGPLTDLGTLSGGNESYAYDINASGQIAGQSNNGSGQTHATFTASPGGSMIDLGIPPGYTSSVGQALNNSGQVAVIAFTANSQTHAFITAPNGGAITDLGLLPGWTHTQAFGINNIGQVVGLGGGSQTHAFVTGPNGVGMTDLGTLGGTYSEADGINSNGVVVGTSATANYPDHAFVWTAAGGMEDLNTLIDPSSGFLLSYATGINDLGQIVGLGSNSRPLVFVLTPLTVQIQSAVSRMTHGGAGNFDVKLPLTGAPGIECRSGGQSGNFTVVISFTLPVISVGSAAVVTGAGSVAGSAIDANNPYAYLVNLTGVANAQTITIRLNQVTVAGATAAAVSVPLSVLLGDVNGDGVVNVGDTIQVRSQSGNSLSTSTFRYDLNADGSINVGDSIIVRNQSGTALSTQSTTTPVKDKLGPQNPIPLAPRPVKLQPTIPASATIPSR